MRASGDSQDARLASSIVRDTLAIDDVEESKKR
jgi:hypothetical protein